MALYALSIDSYSVWPVMFSLLSPKGLKAQMGENVCGCSMHVGALFWLPLFKDVGYRIQILLQN